MHFFSKDEVLIILKEAWDLAIPEFSHKSINNLKLRDYELLETVLIDYFKSNEEHNIEIISAGALMNLSKYGEGKRNKAIAVISLYILLKKELLSSDEKRKFNTKLHGRNLFSSYPKRAEVLSLLKRSLSESGIENERKGQPAQSNFLMIMILLFITGFTFVGAYFLKNSQPEITEKFYWNIERCENYLFEPCNVRITYDLSNINYKKAFFNLEHYGDIPVYNSKGEFNKILKIDSVDKITLNIDGKTFKKDLKSGNIIWRGKLNNDFLPNSYFHGKNILKIKDEIIEEYIENNEEFYVTYSKGRNFDYPIERVTFETKVKNSLKDGGVNCFDISLDLTGDYLGSNKEVGFNFLLPNCTKWAKVKIGEKIYKPSNYDMSPSGMDLNEWRIIRWNFKEKNLNIWIEDEKIYELPYEEELGLLKYIQVIFKGNGAMEYYKITSDNGQILMEDKFNEIY